MYARQPNAVGDMGFCFPHRRKRLRADLIPVGDNSDKMRCRPGKECRAREPFELVECSIHKRRRNMNQMSEVRKGEWVCQPNFPCRLPAMDRDRDRDRRGGAPYLRPNVRPRMEGPGGAPLRGALDRPDASAAASVWAPSAGMGNRPGERVPEDGQALRRLRPRDGRPTARSDGNRKVWCARHGKLLPMNECELAEDCCYLCRDSSTCLSTPLAEPPELLQGGCTELLCSKHNTLRSAGFIKLITSTNSYQCVHGHACRSATLSYVWGATPAPSGAVMEGGMMDPAYAPTTSGDTTGMGYEAHSTTTDGMLYESYGNHPNGNSELIAPPSSREAVSSFFM